ncbi:hypothetical protein WOLCODRAFT_138753 [Wolfiporia cocos MD-104 SS10]|uniref:Uncharacterized protein n=1 Tax=Wolfiporia cocos (strain MD-104) TaxID=742152 RepID=A0A2H3JPB8_WOLCO|nr:hypothetical protein WOLCODRAFT_138753 [Wolfiporia cocos MD-104 SS10]
MHTLNYASCPHSAISLTSPVEPLAPCPRAPAELPASSDMFPYAVVRALRAELDAERRAHARTREVAEKEVAMLSAQLARREAELEACVVDVHMHGTDDGRNAHYVQRAEIGKTRTKWSKQCEELRREPSSAPARVKNEQEALGDEAALVLEGALVRNRVLEQEVEGLARRLGDVRNSIACPIPPPPPRLSERRRNGRSSGPDGSWHAHVDDVPLPRAHDAASPSLSATATSTSDTLTTRSASSGSAYSATTRAPSAPSIVDGASSTSPPPSHASSQAQTPALRSLADAIAAFGAQIDSFGALRQEVASEVGRDLELRRRNERRAEVRAPEDELAGDGLGQGQTRDVGPGVSATSSTNHVEIGHVGRGGERGHEQCERRLRAAVATLRRELEMLRTEGQTREAGLKAEVDRLRHAMEQRLDIGSPTAAMGHALPAPLSREGDEGEAPLQGEGELPSLVEIGEAPVPEPRPEAVKEPPESAVDEACAQVQLDAQALIFDLDATDSVCSMELASPLQPTILSIRDDVEDRKERDAQEERCADSIDPSVILLPETPLSLSEELPSWLLPDEPPSPPLLDLLH